MADRFIQDRCCESDGLLHGGYHRRDVHVQIGHLCEPHGDDYGSGDRNGRNVAIRVSRAGFRFGEADGHAFQYRRIRGECETGTVADAAGVRVREFNGQSGSLLGRRASIYSGG